MNPVIFVLIIILSIFSTGVMSYISMATPIGPWIAPMLVLIGSLLLKIFLSSRHHHSYTQNVAFLVSSASIGGILATAFGFSFPTLFFLDPETFNSWLSQPYYFVSILTGLSLAAGGLGFMLANMFEQKFIVEDKMAFPIGQLVFKMINAGNTFTKAISLMKGFVATIIFCLLQMRIFYIGKIIPTSLQLFSGMKFFVFQAPKLVLRLDQFPMLFSIGFITGHVIAMPLLVGAFLKILFVEPINRIFFNTIEMGDFLMAFCSGIILSGAVSGFIHLIKKWKNQFSNSKKNTPFDLKKRASDVSLYELLPLAIVLFSFLSYFNFSVGSQIYLIAATCLSTYQITAIAGKIGLALMGRFATWVMIPGMLIFGFNPIQITFVATFVEICGGVATDVLFGRKVCQLANLPSVKFKWLQAFGLVISSLSIGIVMWALIHHFGLGSQELFAQRAQARALLINFRNFDYSVLFLGIICGYGLKFFKINPMLVLGGLLMSVNYSLALIAGGMLRHASSNPDDSEPFWSGVFAANSLWVLIRALF